MQLASVVGLVVLTLATVIGAVVVTLAGHDVPPELWDLSKVLAGGSAGAILPTIRKAA